jgi:hypothetical protein
MNTCGTCKYFGRRVDALVDLDSEGPDGWPLPAQYHTCDLLKHLNADSEPIQDQVAGVIDGSGYQATFCVKEEFGCNQWKPRS